MSSLSILVKASNASPALCTPASLTPSASVAVFNWGTTKRLIPKRYSLNTLTNVSPFTADSSASKPKSIWGEFIMVLSSLSILNVPPDDIPTALSPTIKTESSLALSSTLSA